LDLVLASASPRRRRLLSNAGIPHRVVVAFVDETLPPDVSPLDAALCLARHKALAAEVGDDVCLVLGADTVVALDGRIFGKPESPADARGMLGELSGRTHQVITGLCLLSTADGGLLTRAVISTVSFRMLTAREIEAYVATGEPLDKAGAYGIQGGGGAFVETLDGPYDNVVGLPVEEVRSMLEEMS
jgi:nucleoside triphosphate pyrophosphatase